MPSPSNALTLIQRALSLTNSVGTDQTLTANEVTDCLAVFNDMQEQWSLDGLMMWDSVNQQFLLVPGKATYTIGVGGDWNTDRPVNIHQPMYTVLNGGTGLAVSDVSYPCVAMTQDEYNWISFKGQQQQYPERYMFLREFEPATQYSQVTFWPIPSAPNYISVNMDRILTNQASAATVMSFPPGYMKAFVYNLAVELAPQFGKEAKDTVKKIAMTSLASVKKANVRARVAQFERGMGDGYRWQGSMGNY